MAITAITITDIGSAIQIDLGTNEDIMLFPKGDTTVWKESADDKVYLQTPRTSYGIDYALVSSPVVASSTELLTELKVMQSNTSQNTVAGTATYVVASLNTREDQ